MLRLAAARRLHRELHSKPSSERRFVLRLGGQDAIVACLMNPLDTFICLTCSNIPSGGLRLSGVSWRPQWSPDCQQRPYAQTSRSFSRFNVERPWLPPLELCNSLWYCRSSRVVCLRQLQEGTVKSLKGSSTWAAAACSDSALLSAA